MMLAVDELSWIAINIRGSKAEVEVKERTPPPETIDDDTKPPMWWPPGRDRSSEWKFTTGSLL
jgi:hypothetical protein